MPRERNWSDVDIGQGMPAASRSWKRQGMDFPLQPLEAAQLCRPLDFSPVKLTSGFWRPDPRLLFESTVCSNLWGLHWETYTREKGEPMVEWLSF